MYFLIKLSRPSSGATEAGVMQCCGKYMNENDALVTDSYYTRLPASSI